MQWQMKAASGLQKGSRDKFRRDSSVLERA